MKTFFSLELKQVRSETSEDVASLLFDLGALGVQENLDFKQDGSHYEPTILERDITSLSAYFDKTPDLSELEKRFPQIEWQLSEQENKDWLAEWKKGFKSFELVNDVWIVPSWLEAPAGAWQVIRIDPGMAFGTGTHETTKLMSQMMANWACGVTLLDVGTGTGVLVMLAEHLGFQSAMGTEIDVEARRTARENIELNQSKAQILDEQIQDLQQKFDCVVANIIDGVLLELQEVLKKCVGTKGRLIVSGILVEREQIFLKSFNQFEFKLLERRQLGEWVAFAWERI